MSNKRFQAKIVFNGKLLVVCIHLIVIGALVAMVVLARQDFAMQQKHVAEEQMIMREFGGRYFVADAKEEDVLAQKTLGFLREENALISGSARNGINDSLKWLDLSLCLT